MAVGFHQVPRRQPVADESHRQGASRRRKADGSRFRRLRDPGGVDSTGGSYRPCTAPKLASFEVQPARAPCRWAGQQQLRAIARYTDGSEVDVTERALYESNDTAMAEVDGRGLVRALDVSGKVSVMVRYQGRIAVFSAAVPLGASVESLPPIRNVIDEHVFANLKQLGIPRRPCATTPRFCVA